MPRILSDPTAQHNNDGSDQNPDPGSALAPSLAEEEDDDERVPLLRSVTDADTDAAGALRSHAVAAATAVHPTDMSNADEGGTSSSSSSSRVSPGMDSFDAERNDGRRNQRQRNYGGIKEIDRFEQGDDELSRLRSGGTGGGSDGISLESGAQAGVRQIEAISQTWTRWSLIAAYVGIFLLAISTSLEQQTTINLTAYATASFDQHSLVSTVSTVSGVVNSIIKPPMSKIANTFGRLEAYCFAVLLYICGYIQMAASQNFQTFASAQIFYSAGGQGLQMLQQIFIADTSDLLTRALFSSLPDTPFLVTTWIGSPIAESFVMHASWRWGYGVWAIVLPVCFAPLALSLFLNMRKAARKGLLPPRPWKTDESFWQAAKTVCNELDIVGLLLLAAAIALVLLPLTFAAKEPQGYQTPWIMAMLAVGAVCWVLFPAWEMSPRLATRPFLSLKMLYNRNVVVGCVLGFFYFGVFYLSVQPYFYTYLQVVQYQSITSAGRITQIFNFGATVSHIIISLIIWKTKHFKWFIVAGSCVYMVAVGLIMVYRGENATLGQLIGPQICLGIGGGLVNIPTQLAVQAAVPHTDVAAATALFLTMIEIGGAVGGAISGAIWTANVPGKLEAYLPEDSKHLAASLFGDPFSAKDYPQGSPVRNAVNRSLQETMDLLLIVALVFAAMTIICSLFLKDVKLDEVDHKVKGIVIGGGTRRNENENGHANDDNALENESPRL